MIEADHVIQTRRLDVVLIKKKKSRSYLVVFAFLLHDREEMKESENIKKYLNLAGKDMKHEKDCDAIYRTNS